MLLDAGANVDGEAHLENGVETPLQIAVTSGKILSLPSPRIIHSNKYVLVAR